MYNTVIPHFPLPGYITFKSKFKHVSLEQDVPFCGSAEPTDLSSCPEEFLQVIELSVDISTNCHWTWHWLNVRLLHKQVTYCVTQIL